MASLCRWTPNNWDNFFKVEENKNQGVKVGSRLVPLAVKLLNISYLQHIGHHKIKDHSPRDTAWKKGGRVTLGGSNCYPSPSLDTPLTPFRMALLHGLLYRNAHQQLISTVPLFKYGLIVRQPDLGSWNSKRDILVQIYAWRAYRANRHCICSRIAPFQAKHVHAYQTVLSLFMVSLPQLIF